MTEQPTYSPAEAIARALALHQHNGNEKNADRDLESWLPFGEAVFVSQEYRRAVRAEALMQEFSYETEAHTSWLELEKVKAERQRLDDAEQRVRAELREWDGSCDNGGTCYWHRAISDALGEEQGA